MIELKSRILKIPRIFLVREGIDKIEDLPNGLPYIIGQEEHYEEYVRLIEIETIIKSEKEIELNWEYLKQKAIKSFIVKDLILLNSSKNIFSQDIIVNTEVLKDLKLLPEWLHDIESAITQNIHNSFLFNPSIYTRKLGIPNGEFELKSQKKNLIIIDISGSIPRSISKTLLFFSKTMANNYYADLLITGSKSTLYDVNEVCNLDVRTIYDENGMDNDQVYFLAMLSEVKEYNNVIVFGDDDDPNYPWNNSYNKGTNRLSNEIGKSKCKWKISNLVSFHTKSITDIAGYGRWFNVNEENITRKKQDWLKTIV